MAVYLLEDQIGTDTGTIGFPNLSTCMGLVVQTTQRLYGYHVADYFEAGRVEQLGALIAETEPRAQMVNLYGSCYWENRYPFTRGVPATQWENEMNGIADALGYTGPISGFDIGSWNSNNPIRKAALSHIEPVTAFTYLEYRRLESARRCTIHYKRMDKMSTTTGTLPADRLVQRIRQTGANFQRVPTPARIATLTASVVRTESNQGNFHTVPQIFIRSFTKR